MNRLEQALMPARHDCARVTLERGDVTELGKVKTALDPEGQPIDGPAVDGPGAVLSVDGHRVFIPYVLPDFDSLTERVREIADRTTSAQEALNETSSIVEAVDGRVTEAVDEAHAAALAAAGASGTLVQLSTDPLPTTRRNGSPLEPGDLLYLTGPVVAGEARIVGVRTWTGSQWVQHVLAAEHVLATGSIVGDLIAAETEIIAPKSTGGEIDGGRVTGALTRTAAPGSGIASAELEGWGETPRNGYVYASALTFRTMNGWRAMDLVSGGPTNYLNPTHTLRMYKPPSADNAQGPLAAEYTPDGMFRYNAAGNRITAVTGEEIMLLRASGDPKLHIYEHPSATTYAGSTEIAATGPLRLGTTGNGGVVIGRNMKAEGDTNGWINLPLLSGFTAGSTGCQYRIQMGMVYLRGLVTRTAGAFPASFTPVAVLPVAARPPETTDSYPSMTRTDGNLALIAVTSAGSVNAASGPSTDRVALSAIAPYPVI